MNVHDLLPAYALGALDEAERTEVEAALAQDADLRAELALYDEVMEGLALSVPQIAPPPDLRQKIMAQAHTPPIRRINWRVYLPAAAILLVLFVVLLLQLLQQEDRVERILNDPEAQWIAIQGEPEFANLSGNLVVASNQREAVLVLNNLPPMQDQSYQLWFIRGEERLSRAVFQSAPNEMLITLPPDFESFQAFGVTVEPEGGSPSPTGRRVFGVPIPQEES